MAFTPSTLHGFALKDPRDGTIGYIGRSSDPQAYLDQLIEKSHGGWIGELSNVGKKPQLVILKKTNSEDGAAAEKKWTDKYRAQRQLIPSFNRHAELTQKSSAPAEDFVKRARNQIRVKSPFIK